MTAPLDHPTWGDERIPARIWQKGVVGADGCWLWTGAINSGGYGNTFFNGQTWKVHRLAYILLAGPIPEGMQLDHVCHTNDLTCPGNKCVHRGCFNPSHLEPVTHTENAFRGRSPIVLRRFESHCSHGHEWNEENTHITTRGRRSCRACDREWHRRRAAS